MGDENRYHPSKAQGLSKEQVEQRVRDGLTNEYKSNKTKSYGQIIKEHFWTFFNILNFILAGLLIAVGAYKDLAFMVVVIVNFMIGLIQEFSSKRTLDKLSLIVAAKVNVLREGQIKRVSVGEIVLDDVMELKMGNQICADSTVLSGYIEVNESLITGESDVIVKHEGDYLYSGSFVVSGTAQAKVEHIGADNYANQISASAKEEKKRKSELYSTMGLILRVISFVIVPLGVMLFYKQNVILGLLPNDAVVKTVAALIAMIPEGLVLMTSIAFVASTVFLAYDKTLVQDIYGIETLARADIICLDKTGTLTEGELKFDRIVPLKDVELETIMRNFCGATQDENATMAALREQFSPAHDYAVLGQIPFSSARKYSGVCFEDKGTYILGAADFVFPKGFDGLKQQAEELSENGIRVIVLAHSKRLAKEQQLPEELEPIAFFLLCDRVRKDAKETLEYFYKHDVQIKIISGDHPKTVAYIAEQAGVLDAQNYVDASTLKTREELERAVSSYNIFGRVLPQQKKELICIMKEQGHQVAMMGDGVNDVLALKEANCSVAVASGSDAAKNISDIVLMDSNLKHLLHVVEDGRKIINNIQRVATLFITKTVYSVLLALATLFLFESAYPFTPLQLVITSFVTIGAPSFFLALEPQYERIKGRFIRNVLVKSLPGGLCIALSIILVNFFAHSFGYAQNELSTMCVYLVVAGGLWVLLKVSLPLSWIRRTVLIGMAGLFVALVIFFHGFFEIYPINLSQILMVAVLIAAMPLLMTLFEKLMQKFYAFWGKRKKQNDVVIEKLNQMRSKID